MPTVTLKQLKSKVIRSEQKNGVPLFIQKRTERFGKFNKVKRLTKTEPLKSINLYRNTPKANYKRVVSQIKTNAFRANNQVCFSKSTRITPIQEVSMPKQRFPQFPSTRKGRLGQILSCSERLEKSKTNKNYIEDDLVVDFTRLNLDLEAIEVDFDYGTDPEDEVDEVDMDVDYE